LARSLEADGAYLHSVAGARGFEALLEAVRRRTFRRRTYARLALRLGHGAELGVGVYLPVYDTKPPSAVKVVVRRGAATAGAGLLAMAAGSTEGQDTASDPRTADGDSGSGGNNDTMMGESREHRAVRLSSKASFMHPETLEVVQPYDVREGVLIGQSWARFSRQEMQAMKRVDVPGIQLFGFKPRKSLLDQHNLRAPYFLYPHERDVKGSRVAMLALMRAMRTKDVVGIARVILRSNDEPRFVALMPAWTQVDEDGAQLQPPGLFAIPLPYGDDLPVPRYDPPAETGATEGEVGAARGLVVKGKRDWRSRELAKPTVQKFYANLRAIALGEQVDSLGDEDGGDEGEGAGGG